MDPHPSAEPDNAEAEDSTCQIMLVLDIRFDTASCHTEASAWCTNVHEPYFPFPEPGKDDTLDPGIGQVGLRAICDLEVDRQPKVKLGTCTRQARTSSEEFQDSLLA